MVNESSIMTFDLKDVQDVGFYACVFLSRNYLLLGLLDCPRGERHEGDDKMRLVVCDIRATSRIQETMPNHIVDACEFHFPQLEDRGTIVIAQEALDLVR